MGVTYVYERRTAFAAAALLLLSLSLGGCATSGAGTSLMDARAQAVPPKTNAYPLVEDMPPDRQNPVMTLDERSKLQKDLTAARDRQAATGKKPKDRAPGQPAKP